MDSAGAQPGLQKSDQAAETKPQINNDPYAHTVLNPDFLPTRSDLMGASANQLSPRRPPLDM